DGMLRGGGYFRGSTILVSGTAGTGKSSVAAHLAERGVRCLFFAFEESEAQYLRNMRSIGLHLAPHVESGLMRFRAVRPTLQGLEMHLVQMHKLVRDLEPADVIDDPISNLVSAGSAEDARSLMTRLIDFLKSRGTTAMLTNLSTPHGLEETDLNVSSIADTWLLLRDVESDGERRRILFVLKSRGMAHSNRLHEFLITDRGVALVPVEASAAVSETTARPARRQDARR